MLVKETKVVERELHVAPCLECGHTDIALTDSNYSSFNQGGGKCKRCGHEATGAVGCLASMDDLAAIWNAANDIPCLIAQEEQKILLARQRIAELRKKAGPMLRRLHDHEERHLMPVAEFEADEADGGLTSDDGYGVWATATHRSDLRTNEPRPEWATHVLWFNR